MFFRKLLCLCFAVAVLFVSCSDSFEESSEKLVAVRLSTVSEKVLSVSDNSVSGNVRFYYTATPNYSGHAKGKTNEPVEIVFNNGSAEIGEFSQGSWTFEVFAENESNRKVMSGLVSTVLEAGQENVICVNLRQSLGSGAGKLKLGFSVPYSGEGEYALALNYRKAGTSEYSVEKWFSPEVLQTGVEFSGEITLPSGIYELNFIYMKDGIQLGGETVAAAVVASGVTSVNGSIESGLNVQAGITVNLVMTGENTFAGEAETYSEVELPLSWSSEGNLATSYDWELNGNNTNCHTGTYTFCEKETGIYTVVCIAQTEYGNQCSTFTVNVKVPNSINFTDLRCLSLEPGEVCIGYLDKSDNPVEFPMLFNGDVNSGKTPEDYGLKAIIADATVSSNVSEAVFIQVDGEWERNPSANYYSVVWSYSKAVNKTLREAVIRTTLSSGGLSYCSSLETVVFGTGVEKLPTNCMKNDSSLKTVYISKDVKEVATNAFSGCNALTSVYLEKGSKLTREKLYVQSSVNVVTDCEGDIFR